LYPIVLVVIALLVISTALLWRDNTASEDTDTLTTWASAIFLSIAVTGPGLLAKAVFALLVPAEAHAKNRRRLLREIKRAETIRQKAAEKLQRLQDWHSWYVQEANRMHSIYLLAYHEARAKNARTRVENPYQS
jgi:hypothetical protein